MSQEGIKLPITEKVGKQDGTNMRRNSTGSERIPNYLRASTGSCHDFCKYGKHTDFEANKAKTPTLRRTTAQKNNAQNPVQSVAMTDKTKRTVDKLKHTPDSRDPLQVNPKTARHKGSSPFKKAASPKSAPPNYGETSPSSKSFGSLKPKHVNRTPSSSADTPGGTNCRRNIDVRIGQKKGTFQVEKKASPPLVAALSSKPSQNRVANMTKQRRLKVVSRLNKHMGEENTLYATLAAAKSPKPPSDGTASLNGRKHMDVEVATTLNDQKLLRKAEPKQFVQDNDEETSSVVENLKVAFPLMSQNMEAEPMESKNEESPLHVIKVKTENKASGTHQDGSSHAHLSFPSSPHSNSLFSSSHGDDEQDSEYTVSEADDCSLEDNVTADLKTVETYELRYKRRLRKPGIYLSEDKDSAPTKLKFRRGKVIDLQSESNGPRRLRYRQARRLGDNRNVRGNSGRRTYGKRVIADGEKAGDSSHEKVVLRHQDAEEKKDAEISFNNVIEETASKLVETRKSKVKALVGAFETVISLQDGKPQTKVVSGIADDTFLH